MRGTIKEKIMDKKDIDHLEGKIYEYNEDCKQEALSDFNDGPVPKMKWTMQFLLDKILGRIEVVRSGTVPDEFGSYTYDELARVLATKTFLEYTSLDLDEDKAADAAPDVSFEEVSYENSYADWTPEFGLWRKLLTALGEYMREAAIFAKSVNPSSTAARLYLRALRIIQRIEKRNEGYTCATKDEAIAIIRLEHVASERLWVDAQFAALPPFRKRKETVRRKGAAKAKKSKKAKN